MSDMGDDFKAMRLQSQKKRRRNNVSSTELLTRAGIEFVTYNLGEHLVVLEIVDFWPSTGLWIFRESKKKGRGVFSLIKELKEVGTNATEN